MKRLRVVSWNVGRLYTPTSNNKLADADIPRVAGALFHMHADVILLQELVDRDQLEAIGERLPGFIGELASECVYDRHVAAFVREPLAPEFEQTRLRGTGRGVVIATFSAGGARAAAFPLHFDILDARRRRLQALDAVWLAESRHEPLVIAAGDLNLDPRIAAGVPSPVDLGSFELLLASLRDGGHRHEPSLLGLLRVDHVFARGPLLHELETRVRYGVRLPLGDHDPLVCDLVLA